MKRLPSRLAGACSAILGTALLAVPGLANANGIKIYSYAAKFVCEEENGTDVDTSVNIHNPSLTANADYKVKVVIPDEGYYFLYIEHPVLYPDSATVIDCDYFEQLNGQAPPGIDITDFEGFLVVLSKRPLDVVGLYEVEEEEEGAEDVDVVVYSPQVGTYAPTVWTSLGNPT